jgi:predicted DNA-binding ribbon-helix-helix protein
MRSLIIKRSIMIAGRATSVSLEEAFWKAFREIAGGRHMTSSELADEISAGRKAGNLSSAIRLFVLDFYRNQISAHHQISARQKQRDETSAT